MLTFEQLLEGFRGLGVQEGDTLLVHSSYKSFGDVDGGPQTVIRALEVYLIAGRPISELQRRAPPAYRILQIGLRMARERLYARIDARVDAMMAAGLLGLFAIRRKKA